LSVGVVGVSDDAKEEPTSGSYRLKSAAVCQKEGKAGRLRIDGS
jgi:hypothetical protein